MKISLGIDKKDIDVIEKLKEVATDCRKELETKGEIDSFTENCYELLSRIEALINNEMIETAPITLSMKCLKETSPIWLCYGDIPVHPVHVEELTSVRKVAKQYGFNKEEDLGFLKFKILLDA